MTHCSPPPRPRTERLLLLLVLTSTLWGCTTSAAQPQALSPTPTLTPTAPRPTATTTSTATATPTPAPTISLGFLTPTAVVTTAQILAPTPTAPPVAWGLPEAVVPEPFGVNIHFIWPLPGELDRLGALGVRWIRMDMSWSDVERERGRYDFAGYDQLVAGLTRQNLRALFILDYGNDLYGGGPAVLTDEGRAAFARFATIAAARYRGRGIIWEIWNEPNIERFWHAPPDPMAYARLVQAVVPAIRRVDPSAWIVGPAIAGFSPDYFVALAQTGMLHQLDAVTVHPYRAEPPESAQAEYLALRTYLDRVSPHRHIPILSSEWGYTTHESGLTLDTQAAYLVRQWLFHLTLDVNLSIWYDWRNDGPDPADVEQNFGTVFNDFSPKPASRAAQTLNRTLGGYRYQRRLPLPDPADYVLLFQRDDAIALATWTTTATHTITLPVACETVQAVSLTGATETLTVTGRQLALTLTEMPRYIHLCPGEATQRLGHWRPTQQTVAVDATGAGRLLVAVENPFGNVRQAELELTLGEEMLGAALGTLSPGERALVSLPIQITDMPRTPQPITLHFITPDLLPLQTAQLWLIPAAP